MTKDLARREIGFGMTVLAMLGGLGPAAAGAQVWEVDNHGFNPSGLQSGQQFGASVAICDIDGDDVDDLVVGAPRYDSVSTTDAGAWSYYWGAADRSLTYDHTGVSGNHNTSRAGLALACGDFDHDGRGELAIANPWADTSAQDAGVVVIQQYEGGGWASGGLLSQAFTSGETPPEAFDHFGYRLAVGNFNGDVYQDLAVGTPHENIESPGSIVDAGVVQIFYGSSTGLRTDNPQTIFSPNTSGSEQFGRALAAGDFDDDGFQDLAVGAPYRAVAGHANAGAVEIYYGSAGGLVTAPQVFTDDDMPLSSVSAADENFGFSLAAAEFDGTLLFCAIFPATHCYRDLAIGVPGQLDGAAGAGKVMVLYGGVAGLSAVGAQRIRPSNVGAGAEANDGFGTSLAAGHLGKIGFSPQDLVIGTPNEDDHAVDDGVFHIVFGDTSGLNAGQAAQLVDQSSGFWIAPAQGSDEFGAQIAIGDLDHDGWGDIAVGVPLKTVDDTGAVQVLYGALFADGFETNGTTKWGP